MEPLPVPTSTAVSARMQRQARKDTGPELALRRRLHAMGLRYRVGLKVPGLPRCTIDVAFTRARVAVFVDGCFWHSCPEHATSPAANRIWWAEKLDANRARDGRTTAHLERLGWTVIRIWEHENADVVAPLIADVVRGGLTKCCAGPDGRLGRQESSIR